MGRTCDCTFNRDALLSSEVAVCFYCFQQFPASEIVEWCDGEDSSQTAICPYCWVDSVVGFNGGIDVAWVQARHKRSFGDPIAPPNAVQGVLDRVADASFFGQEGEPLTIDAANAFGDRPLHLVITWGDVEATDLLLDAGAPLDAKGERGNTALHHSILMGHFEIARRLIARGADQSVRNDDGKLARDLCWEGEWDSLGLKR